MDNTSFHSNNSQQPQVVDPSYSGTLNAIFNEQNRKREEFYLTGFETISFNQSRGFAIETILDSVVPFEREILIISEEKTSYQQWIKKHNTNALVIEKSNSEDLSFRLFLQPEISHVILTVDSSNPKEIENLKEIGLVCEAEKVELIVDCIGEPLSFKTMKLIDASFFIYDEGAGNSTVIAKRSRLVQTEGMSRSFTYDLYGYWQKAIMVRGHGIEPMAV